MAEIIEYQPPDFLAENTEVDDIHERMLEVLPDDLDVSEGSYPWDFTRPTAIEHARFKQYELNEAIQLIWPMFASGIYLDYHGKIRNLERKDGVKAHGALEVKGIEGTLINKGDLFATESINDVASVSYEAMETVTIPESGTITFQIQCTDAGIVGNAAANTIVLKETVNDGITSLTNPAAFTNGIEPEEDEDYKARIVEYDQTQEYSYIGSVTDYKRWANEVDGVGSVDVIPAQDDSGLVTIVVIDGNGNPASEEICTAVYNHIMRPDAPELRLPAPQAKLSVIPPSTYSITITATIELDSTIIYSDSIMDQIKESYLQAFETYLPDAIAKKEIKYTKISNILGDIPEVYDYKDLKLNNGVSNVSLDSNVMPVIDKNNITFTVGTV